MNEKTTGQLINGLEFKAFCYNGLVKDSAAEIMKMSEMTKDFRQIVEHDDFYKSDKAVGLTGYMFEKMEKRDMLQSAAVIATKAAEVLKSNPEDAVAKQLKEKARNAVAFTSLEGNGSLVAFAVRNAPNEIQEDFVNHTVEILSMLPGKASELKQRIAVLDNL